MLSSRKSRKLKNLEERLTQISSLRNANKIEFQLIFSLKKEFSSFFFEMSMMMYSSYRTLTIIFLFSAGCSKPKTERSTVANYISI